MRVKDNGMGGDGLASDDGGKSVDVGEGGGEGGYARCSARGLKIAP